MQNPNSSIETNEQLVQIILNIYQRLHQLDASSALQETKEKINKLFLSETINDKVAEILDDISNKCFDFWAPLCEMAIYTYRDIQNHILPQLRELLSPEYQVVLENKIKENKFTVYDFNSLKHLPDAKFDKKMAELDEKDDLDYDDHDDKHEDYTYEDGSYCSACQQRPCMCSDPERTSTTWSDLQG